MSLCKARVLPVSVQLFKSSFVSVFFTYVTHFAFVINFARNFLSLQMQVYLCQMYSFLRVTVPTPALVQRLRAPPPHQPPDTTVHIAVEGQGMNATDQVHSIVYIKTTQRCVNKP